MRDFRKVKVWEKGHQLALKVYRATEGFPKDELYGLTSQMRRASVSIPTNIAEGCGRSGDAELARFLQIAMGSASELEYLILLARDLHLLDAQEDERLTSDTTEVKKNARLIYQKAERLAVRYQLSGISRVCGSVE